MFHDTLQNCYLGTRVQVITITPEDATHILNEYIFVKQRNIKAWWVDELSEIIKAGSFAQTTITFCYCQETKRYYLVDGYHRLSGCIKAQEPVTVTLTILEAFIIEDVYITYTRLDRGVPRTLTDAIVARDLTKETGLATVTLRAGISALNVIQAGFKKDSALASKRGCDEKFDRLNDWVSELSAYTEATRNCPRHLAKRFRHSAIMAVGLTLFKHQPEKADQFFRQVATASNLEIGSGPHTFHQKVLLAEDAQGSKVGVATLCRWVASCWNAFSEQKPLKGIRANDPSKPIILLETPYTDYQSRR